MRKISDKAKEFQKKKQIRLGKKERHAANLRRAAKYKERRLNRKYAKEEEFSVLESLVASRKSFTRSLYHGKYTERPTTVLIEGDFGIEDSSRVDYFFEKAFEIIDFNNRELMIDLEKCTRVWPSAITMLCSLKQWTELSTRRSTKKPIIKSSTSNSQDVNSYLKYCGFYDYVNRPTVDVKEDYHSNDQVVKIKREGEISNIEIRENEIVALLRRYSTLDGDQIDRFNCVVLIEVLLNVTEHGIPYIDNGWWVLAQYHPRHGIISLCIADNGIGIRNYFMTGPQKADISINNAPLNDADFIKLALTEQISGAILAPQKTKAFLKLLKRYEKGAHRGNGLKRIRDTCKVLQIPFAIVSHNGYVFVDKDGNITRNASMSRKVFAGTLHHFIIPAKRSIS